MTPNEKDYMDRYIYQVIRRLPKAQREEVRMELEELISDMSKGTTFHTVRRK